MTQPKVRKTDWTHEQDMILVDSLVEGAFIGKTKLQVFDEVSRKIGRTPAAVAFRWNGNLSKKYYDKVKRAKNYGREGGERLTIAFGDSELSVSPEVIVIKTSGTVVVNGREIN